ncbi:MAG: Npt1/Npt2 family nucleotide transporter [Candidatus Aminicenantes bacterium]|nr:Npt1/Npt2 family nucleotide transporter [Candidatus Aminicenantes bacterium]
MAERRLHKVLSAVVKIKPGEEVLAILVFFYFFLITAPFGIVKSLRDANFLDDLKAENLPYAYLSAILIAVAVSFHAKLQSRFSRRRLLLSSLVFFILTSLLFWALFSMPDHWKGLALIYWMWANLFVVALTTQFWFLVNDVFNPREAKRLIGFFGSGGILGGIAGNLLLGFLAKPETSHRLLLASTAFLCTCLVVVSLIFSWLKANEDRYAAAPDRDPKAGRKEPRRVGLGDSFRSVRSDAYLRLMAWVVLATGIVSTFIDWQSKSLIELSPAAKANYASFFGRFNAGILVFAFLFQLILTSRFINRFGIRTGLLIYPVIILLCSVGIGVLPTLGFAIALKGSDKALSYSINQSSRELLYIPVLPEMKYRAKVFIDMFLNRFSKAVGGVILLGLIYLAQRRPFAAIGFEPIVWVSFASGAFVLVWIVLNAKISRAYVREVKGQLAKKWERADGVVADRMDVDTAKLVVDAIETRTQSSTLFALHLYDLARQNKLTPEIRDLLGLKPADAPASAARPLFEYDAAPWVPDLDERLPPAEMDKEIREILALGDYQKVMGEYAGKVLEDKDAKSETARMELAKAIGLMDGRSALADKLDDLLGDDSAKVFQYGAESAGKLKKKAHVPLLARKLGDPRTREDARSALERYRGAIAGALSDYLNDVDEKPEIREQAASLLAGIADQEAADALLEALGRGQDVLKNGLIDALDRIRAEVPEVQFKDEVVRAQFAAEMGIIGPAKSPSDLLPLFKLLGLAYDHEDIFRAYQNLLKGTKDSIAYAIELLDHTVSQDIKERLFPLLESFSGRRGGDSKG